MKEHLTWHSQFAKLNIDKTFGIRKQKTDTFPPLPFLESWFSMSPYFRAFTDAVCVMASWSEDIIYGGFRPLI